MGKKTKKTLKIPEILALLNNGVINLGNQPIPYCISYTWLKMQNADSEAVEFRPHNDPALTHPFLHMCLLASVWCEFLECVEVEEAS